MTSSVKLYIYDLSQGLAAMISPTLLGRKIDGIWHTSIVAFDREYFYGSGGVNYCPPGTTMLGQPGEILSLGNTEVPKDLFHEHLRELAENDYQSNKYKLFAHNCNDFSSEISKFLTGNDIPRYITDLPNDVLTTPFGQMIKSAIENIKVDPGRGGSDF